MSVNGWTLFKSALKNINSESMNKDIIGFSINNILSFITKEDILAYASATKDSNPIYKEENPSLPPFFISKLIWDYIKQVLIHKDLKLNFIRMVHAEQKVEWINLPKINDKLEMQMSVEDIIDTSAGQVLVLSGKVISNGSPAAVSTIGLMVRKKKSLKKMNTEYNKKKDSVPKFTRIIQTEIGQNLKYATASGDASFIHTNNFLAKLSGLPCAIMHGICVVAMTTSELCEELCHSDNSLLSGIEVRFASPVIPGEKLILKAYESQDKFKVPFEVFNMKEKFVLKNGLFKYHN